LPATAAAATPNWSEADEQHPTLPAVHRLLTASIFHAGLLHVVFNMMAFVPIGCSLERLMGSVQFMWLIALVWALGDGAYLLIGHAAGLSGMQ
jgi:rhomboid domain-containing protein 1